MAMSEVEVKFLGWEESALALVGRELMAMAGEEAFRRAMVIVPTAESGRRLREWIAAHAGGRPVLMPRMALAGQLIRTKSEGVANEAETLAAWVETLTEEPQSAPWANDLPAPQQESQVQSWALRTADRLMQLQLQMEQYEVTIPDLLRRMAGHEGVDEELAKRWETIKSDEENRWETLQRLFAAVDARLEAWGRIPSWRARQQWLAETHTRTSAPMLILACLPELSPQMRSFLRSYPGRVRIWVHAPETLHAGFDTFGCVKPDFWAERELPARAPAIQVEASAQGLARAALQSVSRAADKEMTLAVCDASFTPAIVTEFAKHGWNVHVPEGRSFRVSDLAALPEALSAACSAEDATWASIEPLLRNVAAHRLAGGSRFDSYNFGKLLDKIRKRLIPSNMSTLMQHLNPAAPLPGEKREMADINELRREEFYRAMQWLESFIHQCRQDICRGLHTLASRLRCMYAGDTSEPTARQMAERLKMISHFLEQHPRRLHEAWALVRHLLSKCDDMLQDSPRELAHVDALGWRELAYAGGESLTLVGLHEGCVPEPLPVDPFLPDSLRQTLGMPCIRSREARDCYLLSALLSRRNTEISIILSRSSADGTGSPVEPSSLLYHCDMETLVERVQHLLRELPVEAEPDRYRDDWSLAPQELQAAEGDMESVREQMAPLWNNPFARESHRFTPSQINKFLACPLRFWMKEALDIDPWETYNEYKAELEAAEYGSLVHAVLEFIGKKFGNKNTVMSVDDMYTEAEKKLRTYAESHYGRTNLPVLVQQQMLDFCSKCLRPFLEWHREQILDGWECHTCEAKVDDWELPLPDGGVAHISMRADRIDHHPASGKWRIIDYKTHERTPKKDHLEVVPNEELWNEKMGADRFPLIDMPYGNSKSTMKPNRWKDVQLPMYACHLMQKEHCSLPELAYFNLPRSRSNEPQFTPMKEMDEAALESAITWATSAITLMREGKCLFSAETFGCKAFGKFSENKDLEDPRTLFHTLKPVTLSQHESCNE